MPNIKPVTKAAKGHNRFCGPAAVSIIAGLDTAQSAALLRQVSGKRSIQGTHFSEVCAALNRLGYTLTSVAKVDPFAPKANPTLAAWLRETTTTRGGDLYLIAAGNHWQVVQGRRYCCGITGQIVSIRDDKVKRRARITGVWRVSAKVINLLSLKASVIGSLQRSKVASAEDKLRRRTQALARRFNIEIETYRDCAPTVWGPSFVDEENDPYLGDHISDGWSDALKRVEEYVDLIQTQPELFC